MKRAFVYVMLGTILFSGSSLSVNSVQAVEKSVISFLSNEKGNYDIFMIDTKGTVLQRLVTDAMPKSALTCSPNGYLFAYTSNEAGDPDIFKMDIRNKRSIRLTHHPDRDLRPAWSPNGKWIAFISDREGNQDVYRMDVDGSNLIRLTGQGGSISLAWSPDSRLIAFDIDKEENHSIYVMNADGGELKQVTGDLPLWPGCTWSPDGEQIAFAAGKFGQEGVNIFTIDVNGKNMHKITNLGQGFRAGNPAWSPDGSCIAYSVVEVDEWPNPANGFKLIFGDSTLYIVDSKGADVGKPLKETVGLSNNHVPVWTSKDFFPVSPDAHKQIGPWGNMKRR